MRKEQQIDDMKRHIKEKEHQLSESQEQLTDLQLSVKAKKESLKSFYVLTTFFTRPSEFLSK